MRLEELVLISRPSLVQEEESNERLHQPKQEVEVQQQDQDVKEEQGSLHIAEAVEVIITLLIFVTIFKQFLLSFSGRGRGVASDRITNEDTDESEEAKDNTLSTIGSLDNDALAALAQRSPRSSKYNFFPDFGKS